MVNEYENLIIPPPKKFRDDYKIRKPITAPGKYVKEMIKKYESGIIELPVQLQNTKTVKDSIITPSVQFRDDYKPKKRVPLLRTKKLVIERPIPEQRTETEKIEEALKGYTESYQISTKNNIDPLVQLQNTQKAIENHMSGILTVMKSFKFIQTLKVTFMKKFGDLTITKTTYFNSKAQTIINQTEIAEALEVTK